MIWHAGQKRATKLEREYTARVRELPCLCCEQFGISRTAALHHIKDGGHRMGERFVIPLCSGHHQADFARGEDYGAQLSVHRDHRKFVEVFGTERSLWEKVQRKLNLPITGWPESKLVPRRIVQESTDDWA